MPDEDRLLRRPEVEQRCGLTCSTIYRLMDEGRFPRPLRVGPKAVRWLESEIGAWVASRPRAAGGDRRSPRRAGGTAAAANGAAPARRARPSGGRTASRSSEARSPA